MSLKINLNESTLLKRERERRDRGEREREKGIGKMHSAICLGHINSNSNKLKYDDKLFQ